jgi:hypothetical protein
LRATEFHAYTRYGLDTVVAWPRIEMLLGQTEADIHQSARGDVAFFVNTCLGAGVLTVTALTCAVLDRSISLGLVSLVGAALVPFAYRAALESALRWGDAIRASVDLHRLDLYRALGLRVPTTPQEEARVARALTRLLLYAEPLADTVRLQVKS